ncbi:hypothetical protein HD593_008862 [Nonomuraea rubra]|uniref:Uncharacterized protein n=1 Tax=Nonomuraea rubra TaxID=46180 RepID=A0A7X0P2G9_9ACTN|nr:hypothetical protein [Nonomuraea rubra]
MPAEGTWRGRHRLPAIALWLLVWVLNAYEFLLAI